ncbi:MAG: hypothetical protein CMN10_14815 [Roseobacter sp.]|nr:hypothetical protein [Roseobacter sp.]MBV49827.1 hypothetical protein [Roseobacter sp.]
MSAAFKSTSGARRPCWPGGIILAATGSGWKINTNKTYRVYNGLRTHLSTKTPKRRVKTASCDREHRASSGHEIARRVQPDCVSKARENQP